MKDRVRVRIAQEAARLMIEEGIREYRPAKQKAAARLGLAASKNLPRNEEIDQALEEYHRLYRAHVQPQHITRLRRLALEAMRFLRLFSPRLVGGVLDGSAGPFSPIVLHLFPEAPEEVIRKLLESGIPHTEQSVSLSVGSPRPVAFPALCFWVDGVEVQLVLLPAGSKPHRWLRKDKTAPKGDLEQVETLVRQADREGEAP
jgi:hypothetical protein